MNLHKLQHQPALSYSTVQLWGQVTSSYESYKPKGNQCGKDSIITLFSVNSQENKSPARKAQIQANTKCWGLGMPSAESPEELNSSPFVLQLKAAHTGGCLQSHMGPDQAPQPSLSRGKASLPLRDHRQILHF